MSTAPARPARRRPRPAPSTPAARGPPRRPRPPPAAHARRPRPPQEPRDVLRVWGSRPERRPSSPDAPRPAPPAVTWDGWAREGRGAVGGARAGAGRDGGGATGPGAAGRRAGRGRGRPCAATPGTPGPAPGETARRCPERGGPAADVRGAAAPLPRPLALKGAVCRISAGVWLWNVETCNRRASWRAVSVF